MKLSLVTLYPRSLLVSSAWSKLAMQKDTSLERSQMLLPHCKVALPPMQDRPLKQNKVALTLPIRPTFVSLPPKVQTRLLTEKHIPF